MATLQDLQDKIVELQAAVDADQAADAAAAAALQAEIDRLAGILASGSAATAADLDAVIASLEVIKTDVAGPNV